MRHGTCFRPRLAARRAGAAPHTAVAELGVVRRLRTMIFECPYCKDMIDVDPAWAGMNGTCPHCRKKVAIPKPPALPHQPMSGLTRCPDCDGPVSTHARACPRCGRPFGASSAYIQQSASDRPTSSAPVGVSYLMAFLFPFVGIIMGIYILTKGQVAHAIVVIVLSLFMMQFWWGFWIGFFNALPG